MRVCQGVTISEPHISSFTWDRTPVDKESQTLSVTCSHSHPHRPVSAPETLALGSCHQAEEKAPQPRLLDHSSAFSETSALCEEGAVSFHSPGVEFSLEKGGNFACEGALSL